MNQHNTSTVAKSLAVSPSIQQKKKQKSFEQRQEAAKAVLQLHGQLKQENWNSLRKAIDRFIHNQLHSEADKSTPQCGGMTLKEIDEARQKYGIPEPLQNWSMNRKAASVYTTHADGQQ